jgi:hypothetical protein
MKNQPPPNLTDLQREIHRHDRERLRNAFLTRWKQLGGPELTEEFRFHPTREWRFDYFVRGNDASSII